jgi:hypothetical protein
MHNWLFEPAAVVHSNFISNFQWPIAKLTLLTLFVKSLLQLSKIDNPKTQVFEEQTLGTVFWTSSFHCFLLHDKEES